MTANIDHTNLGEWWPPDRVVHWGNQVIRDENIPYRRVGFFDALVGAPYPDVYDDWPQQFQTSYEHGRHVAVEAKAMGIEMEWPKDRAVPSPFYNHQVILDRLAAYRTIRVYDKLRATQLPILEEVLKIVRPMLGIDLEPRLTRPPTRAMLRRRYRHRRRKHQ